MGGPPLRRYCPPGRVGEVLDDPGVPHRLRDQDEVGCLGAEIVAECRAGVLGGCAIVTGRGVLLPGVKRGHDDRRLHDGTASFGVSLADRAAAAAWSEMSLRQYGLRISCASRISITRLCSR